MPKRIVITCKKMYTLIEDLLRLSSATRATLTSTVNLGAEVDNIAGQLQRAEPGREVHFRIQRPFRSRADPTLIRTVLENMVANAWKFGSNHRDALIVANDPDRRCLRLLLRARQRRWL